MNLIDTTSPKYLRRMVREINRLLHAGKPVYKKSYPFNVKVVGVVYGPNTRKIIVEDTDGRYTDGGPGDFFFDNTMVCASRASR
jgi:hypothetical protein